MSLHVASDVAPKGATGLGWSWCLDQMNRAERLSMPTKVCPQSSKVASQQLSALPVVQLFPAPRLLPEEFQAPRTRKKELLPLPED